jgi:DNA-binding NarL/FixJ family response regulator
MVIGIWRLARKFLRRRHLTYNDRGIDRAAGITLALNRFSANTEDPGMPCNESGTDVLVAEDFEPFRRFISSTLGKMRDLRVICEVSDGQQAVKKAEELKPHLILLDIGLPGMNGLDAAREIRKLAPESKIIFVSQESSADIVQEALCLGAAGYVVKARAGSELLPAVESACLGKQFVSPT